MNVLLEKPSVLQHNPYGALAFCVLLTVSAYLIREPK